jgi:predicted RNase H-like nuclease
MTRAKIDGKRISKQQFGILSKVREVDETLSRLTGRQVYEGHPEVSFAWMNDESPLLVGKKDPAGKALRQGRRSGRI